MGKDVNLLKSEGWMQVMGKRGFFGMCLKFYFCACSKFFIMKSESEP